MICFCWLLLGKHLFLLENARKPASDQAFLLLFLIQSLWSGVCETVIWVKCGPLAWKVHIPQRKCTIPLHTGAIRVEIRKQLTGFCNGGSSTGSSNNCHRRRPLSAQLHQRLCYSRFNSYGNADRDTHTISRTLSKCSTIPMQISSPLRRTQRLGANNPYSRKEREKMEFSRYERSALGQTTAPHICWICCDCFDNPKHVEKFLISRKSVQMVSPFQ